MIIGFLEKNSNLAFELKLDSRDYNQEELLSIKTKLNLPYYSSSPQFERAYGSVIIKGVVYEYVQKRVYNDTLELLCLPNNDKTALQGIKNDLTKATADGQTTVPVKKGSTTLKLSLPDYCQFFESSENAGTVIRTAYLLQNEFFAFTDFTQRQERPPQAGPVNS